MMHFFNKKRSFSSKKLMELNRKRKQIEDYEIYVTSLSDKDLKNKTSDFKFRLANGATLDQLLPEAFAVCREASYRVLQMKHYPVQLIGGIVLHEGRIAEMRTGEGKTLVATLAAYLNALSGEGVHIVTVNDYLAERDSTLMRPLYEWLGLTVGCIKSGQSIEMRQQAYACDITYGTNNEFGFDYLKDNMVDDMRKRVQRQLNYAIIDEIDSVLIDEARTPLIISGEGFALSQYYKEAHLFAKRLKRGSLIDEEQLIEEGDYIFDEKTKSIMLTQQGVQLAESYFNVPNLSDPSAIEIQHHINLALKANYTMHKEEDYIVDGEEGVVIVDSFTGRLMAGRRYSDGLHQAIEEKEGVGVQKENCTLATITFQSFFNKYKKKSGMTGTAKAEESEFKETYSMDVVTIPTHKPIQRVDHNDIIFRTKEEKYAAIVAEIASCYKKKQPVLVGTTTIDTSEYLSHLLRKQGISHQVLNAKHHMQEAKIISEAGEKGAVTIATNMAGRGTDIKLGEGVAALGGLKIIGTERHESRRIDDQLRGRSGRQGDVGESIFFLSLEDDLLRIHTLESSQKTLARLVKDKEGMTHNLLSKAVAKAQKQVESVHQSSRQDLLKFDRTNQQHCDFLYQERLLVLESKDPVSLLKKMVLKTLQTLFEEDGKKPLKELNVIREDFLQTLPPDVCVQTESCSYLEAYIDRLFIEKEQLFGKEQLVELIRYMMLKIIDQKWVDYLDAAEQLRQGVYLFSYGQKEPAVEYQFLSSELFDELMVLIREAIVYHFYCLKLNETKQIEVGNKKIKIITPSV